ncbi:MAG: Holliday junction resolvase RecU [Anaeromicrobium sp.]|jgi:recombination protein U|uniref:Holliday junction resolvase RecU n=1 Tax=Anaeromicrobium sp. TaxID=1929132 RepID=UPI0025E0E34B|nr:Holliday junction resolvase RecU [Anaeromicrobium sp.]MCT4593154.1 Holliday junction resolvase RecU [Anaeromicrobium sp.]
MSRVKGNYIKNHRMANKGKLFEKEVILSNTAYKNSGIALIQKISTPWNVVRQGKKIVSAFPEEKSTLDFRGTVKGGMSVSFDCKETVNENGLPLRNIEPHQIEYMRMAIAMGETSFILCYMKKLNKRFLIQGNIVVDHWDRWQENKGKRGFNYIPKELMTEVKSGKGIILDYLKGLDKI